MATVALYLQAAVHVARVAKVLDSSEARPRKRLELCSRLCNFVEVVRLVQLHLRGRCCRCCQIRVQITDQVADQSSDYKNTHKVRTSSQSRLQYFMMRDVKSATSRAYYVAIVSLQAATVLPTRANGSHWRLKTLRRGKYRVCRALV